MTLAPPPPAAPRPPRGPHWPWAIATAVVAAVAIVTAGALSVFHSARRLPTDVIESGRQALRELHFLKK